MADVDLGTEHMRSVCSHPFLAKLLLKRRMYRWMGDTRFVLGYISGVMTRRKYPCEVHVRVVCGDKKAIVRGEYPRKDPEDSGEDEGLPPLRYGTVNDPLPSEGWKRIEKPTISLYAGAHRFAPFLD
jgi:sphingosine kinase